jgi:hypothetical protein
MPVIVAVLVVLGIVLLTTAFIVSARTIRRDMNRRMSNFQSRLEDEANAVVDNLLKRTKADD